MMVPTGFGGPITAGVFSFNVPADFYNVNVHFPPDVGYSPGYAAPVNAIAGQTSQVVLKAQFNDVIIQGSFKDESGAVVKNIEAHVFALLVSLIIYLFAGLFITQIYIEMLYWLLMFPLFLYRSVQNTLIEQEPV